MRYNLADKRVKHCKITVTGYKSSVFSLQSTSKADNKAAFTGTKNKVLKELKVFLKEQNVPKSTLSKIMDAVNNTSYCYKYSNKDSESVDIKAFNEFTGIFYNIRIEYNLSRLFKVAPKNRVNRRGENIYKKRMLQGCTNNLLKRLEVANKAIDEIKLEEAIFKPFVEQVFKNVSINKDGTIPFNPPYETVIVVAPDIEVLVRWKVIYDTDVRIKIKVKSVLYRGKEIRLEASSTTLSESYVAGIEYSVKELTEVCNSIKSQTRDNDKI